jgi:CheY-like chemotaxis protein
MTRHILLADDDQDDCFLFEDVLKELSLPTQLTVANDGLQLMQILEKSYTTLPDLIMLDLNMPLKNGFECLKEIKQHQRLRHLPVYIFSTSAQRETVDVVYNDGANLYIRKPETFQKLKDVIQRVLLITDEKSFSQPPREKFLWDI